MNPQLKNRVRQFLPRALKPHTIRAGPLKNWRIVTSWHDYPAAILGTTERELLEWFAQNVGAGETWLDIGAHYGYTALALARLVGTEGRVFAFEPMLTSAGCLAQTRRINQLPQVTILPLALGDSDGLALEHLPVVRGMVDNTLKQSKRPADATASEPDWQETLLVANLDNLWQSLGGGNLRVHGVKIDVQGMELHVLRGMMQLLRTRQPKLVVEVHHGVSRAELLDLAAQGNYSRTAIPLEPIPGETTAQFVDDKSYVFTPLGAPA